MRPDEREKLEFLQLLFRISLINFFHKICYNYNIFKRCENTVSGSLAQLARAYDSHS